MIELFAYCELNQYNNGMIKAGSKMHKEILEYTLTDYQFLEDYEIIDSLKPNKHTFTAQIKNSDQKVRFIKKKFAEDIFPRFKALCKLYKSGIVLADNMFIIEECEQHYFYVIEAEIQVNNPRFRTLMHYLYEQNPSEEERKAIVSKIKILMDCLHQEGQSFAGLDTRSIIIDDENHIYLAPFQLELQLKTDNFSRAYYPPELLAKIEKGSSQIDEAKMMQWDYWSFGCIIAEVLFYNSPLFIDTSLLKQMKRIKQFTFVDELTGLDEPMKNVIINSLNKDESIRNISTTQTTKIKNNENDIDLKKTIKNWKKNSDLGTNDDIIELNIYKDTQIGDSQLIINFLTLEGLPFKEELHFVAELNKKYHFYIDFIPDSARYKLNKSITIRNNFHQLSKLLDEPIKIEAKEGCTKTIFFVNLQSLVMMHEGRRLWNKQLLGTYKPEKDSPCPQAKLKISCVLNSPEYFVEETPQIKQNLQQIKLPVQQIQLPPIQNTLGEIANTFDVGKKKKPKKSSKCDIPSISQISKSISSITQHFMKKLSLNEQPKITENSLKSKLQRVLQLS